jgi:hypothetical protein
MHVPRVYISAVCLLCSLSIHRSAAAEAPEPAEALFYRGVEHMEAGRFERACPLIEQSHQLDPRPGTLFTLAECERYRGRNAVALQRYDEYLAMYATLPPEKKARNAEREPIAHTQRAALEKEVAYLSLHLPVDAPDATVVKVNEAVVKVSVFGTSLIVEPGEHVVTVQAPGRPITTTRVEAAKGEKRRLMLSLSDPSVSTLWFGAEPAIREPGAAPSAMRIGSYAAGGVGTAGIIAGVITGALAANKKKVVDAGCSGAACTSEGMDAADSMQALGLVSTIGFSVGLVGAGTAVALYFLDPSRAASKEARADHRVSVGVTAVSDGGAALGIQGVW